VRLLPPVKVDAAVWQHRVFHQVIETGVDLRQSKSPPEAELATALLVALNVLSLRMPPPLTPAELPESVTRQRRLHAFNTAATAGGRIARDCAIRERHDCLPLWTPPPSPPAELPEIVPSS